MKQQKMLAPREGQTGNDHLPRRAKSRKQTGPDHQQKHAKKDKLKSVTHSKLNKLPRSWRPRGKSKRKQKRSTKL